MGTNVTYTDLQCVNLLMWSLNKDSKKKEDNEEEAGRTEIPLVPVGFARLFRVPTSSSTPNSMIFQELSRPNFLKFKDPFFLELATF